MKKLMEKEASYYRLNLHAGNILYFSHAKDVREDEYIDLDIKDVVAKVDEIVDVCNGLAATLQNTSTEISEIKKCCADMTALQAQIDAINIKITPVAPIE